MEGESEKAEKGIQLGIHLYNEFLREPGINGIHLIKVFNIDLFIEHNIPVFGKICRWYPQRKNRVLSIILVYT